MESTSPGQQQQVIVSNAPDYGGMPAVGTETTPPGGQEESCATFAGYDYASNVRLGNGYKFNGAAGNYASYPSNATPPAVPHQVPFDFFIFIFIFFTTRATLAFPYETFR